MYVDRASMSQRPQNPVYTIPQFYSQQEAEQFAHDMKGVAPIYNALLKHMQKIKSSSMTQYAFCQAALSIMKQYYSNRLVHKKDKAMSTRKWHPVFYEIPIFVDYKDAMFWVNTQGWNDSKIHHLRQRVGWYLDLARNQPRIPDKEDAMNAYWNFHQSELCKYALQIMLNMRVHGMQPDQAQVGADFYASSIPITRK